jgi:hypothetical protein
MTLQSRKNVTLHVAKTKVLIGGSTGFGVIYICEAKLVQEKTVIVVSVRNSAQRLRLRRSINEIGEV